MSEFGGMFETALKYLLLIVFIAGLLIGFGLWVLYQFTAPWDTCLKIFGVGGCI